MLNSVTVVVDHRNVNGGKMFGLMFHTITFAYVLARGV
jgi:hypothetical protein